MLSLMFISSRDRQWNFNREKIFKVRLAIFLVRKPSYPKNTILTNTFTNTFTNTLTNTLTNTFQHTCLVNTLATTIIEWWEKSKLKPSWNYFQNFYWEKLLILPKRPVFLRTWSPLTTNCLVMLAIFSKMLMITDSVTYFIFKSLWL